MPPVRKREGRLRHVFVSGLIVACSMSSSLGWHRVVHRDSANTTCPLLERCTCSVSKQGATTFCRNVSVPSVLNGDMARLEGVFHRSLYLRHVQITELPATWFSNHTVIMLNIRHCPLRDIGEASIAHIKRLSHVRLDDNEFTYVPRGLSAAKRLRWLQVRGNRIKALQGVLRLHELAELDLSFNEIETVEENYLSGLPKLMILNLSQNKIKYLPSNIFKETRELKIAILHSNSFARMNNVFRNLHYMQNLNLRRNMIADIDWLLNTAMSNLRTAYFEYNKISSIPDFSTSMSTIRKLVFRGNQITRIAPRAFKSLQQMSHLDLSHNSIRHLNETAFSANSMLESLNLSRNKLTTVTGVFKRTRRIRHLRLSFNRLRSIVAAFSGLTLLRHLSICNNLLTCIPDYTFRDNRGLLKISLSGNGIRWIGRNAFQGLGKLKMIALRENQLLSLNGSLRNLPKIGYIDASLNAIQGFETGEFIRNVNLATVLLVGNNISSLKGAFIPTTYLRLIEVSGNRLHRISRSDFAPKMRRKPSLFIDNNPLICDCSLAWLVRANSQVRLSAEPTCTGPPWLQRKSLLTLTEEDLVTWKDDCESGCHCHCHENPLGSRAITVNCSSAKLGRLPAFLPGNTTALYLSDNGLELLDDTLKKHASHLQLLSLRDNRPSGLNLTALPRTVNSLDLRNNRLKQLPYSLVTQHNLTSLWLSDNPFQCDCADYYFRQWVQAHSQLIPDAREIRCARSSNPLVSRKHFLSLGQKQLCPTSIPKGALFLLLALGLLVVALALSAIYLRYGRVLKLWACTRRVCGWTPCIGEEDLEAEKLFDVFVSFSSKDTIWVHDQLLPRLDALGLSYCTYERNFKGGFLLQDIIRDAVACSGRTLLLLTQNFVASEWCRWEFRLAHQRALEDNINRLVIVLIDDVAAGALDEDLRLYVRAANHLRWGEPNFWDRLQSSLPNKDAKRKLVTEQPPLLRMTDTGGSELQETTAKEIRYKYS